MLLKNLTTACAVAGLAVAPVAAHAGPLGSVGAQSNIRASAPSGKASDLAGGSLLLLLGLAVGIGTIVIVAASDDDDDTDVPPVSF